MLPLYFQIKFQRNYDSYNQNIHYLPQSIFGKDKSSYSPILGTHVCIHSNSNRMFMLERTLPTP